MGTSYGMTRGDQSIGWLIRQTGFRWLIHSPELPYPPDIGTPYSQGCVTSDDPKYLSRFAQLSIFVTFLAQRVIRRYTTPSFQVGTDAEFMHCFHALQASEETKSISSSTHMQLGAGATTL